MKTINSTSSWQIWTRNLSGVRIHGMKTKLVLLSALILTTIMPAPTNAGFELDKRQIWPVLTSNEVMALILEYHLIETPPANARYPDLYVKDETFKKHLAMLRETGLKCISFEDAISQLEAGNFDTSNVIMTFDDGYLDNFAVAQKLANLGHGGTFYIPTFYPGKSQPAQSLTYMSWDDIKKISEMGFEIGAHTVHHTNLRNLKLEVVNYEISESLNDIYSHVGKKPTTFSIPMGTYTNQVIVEIEKYGLKGCVTSNYGYLTKFNVNNAPRIKIKEDTGMRSVIELYLSRNLKYFGEIDPGAKGPRIRSFRSMLTRLGHPLVDSDVYNEDMVKAIKDFQKIFELEENGKLNTTTMDKIVRDFITLTVKGI